MKKICFHSHSSELNGAELNLLQIIERINRQRFYPSLIVPREGLLCEEASKLGIAVKIIPAKWWLTEKGRLWKQPLARIWNIPAVRALAYWIRQEKIDLVFSNSCASFSGALAAQKARVPHVWYIHEMLAGETPQLAYMFGQNALARKIGRFSCRVLVNSMATQAFFGDKSNVRLVYNGVKLQDGDRNESRKLRSRWDLDNEDIVFGIVGKVCEEKGQRETIEALGELGRKQPVKLLVVGPVKSRAYFAELEKVCEAYDIKDRVVFTGYQRDVIQHLRSMDCLIVASRAESFGRTIIEAMSVKTPVIAVKSGGIPEIISHESNGFLLESRTPRTIQEGMLSFLDNRDAHERAAEEGFRTVQEKFLLSDQLKKIEIALEECLKKP
jgi:glycosyltransferase involved in cell wall biosynthesis